MRFPLIAFAIFSFLGFGGNNINFDSGIPGEMPPGWTSVQTRPGPAADWTVRRDTAAPSQPNVLSQVSRSASPFDSHIAVFDRTVTRDGNVSVKLRIRPGEHAEAAGLVFRYRGPNNYMGVAFNAAKHRVTLFAVEQGQPHAIPPKNAQTGVAFVAHDVRPGVWYLARVAFRGPRVRVMVGNRLLFEADDPGIHSLGKTGVFTSGGTIASFDDFRVEPTH